MLLVFLAGMLACRPVRLDRLAWRRILRTGVLAAAAVAAALTIPNALRWRSDNPYLESVKSVANYEEGSGHGRLVQYERTLRLALRHPLFGVGPGNWPVEYPQSVPRDDPSLDTSAGGVTFNPWPSSDWVASIAERGPAATALLMAVFAVIALGASRRLFSAVDSDDGLAAIALLGTAVAAVVAGMFDAVLLLALPAMLVWASLGALTAPPEPGPEQAAGVRRAFVLVAIAIALAGAARSGAQLAAMEIVATHGDRASLERASVIDPGNYRLHLRLARSGRQRCGHARAAHALFPAADAARELSRRCE
jgi:O-antigen ligase